LPAAQKSNSTAIIAGATVGGISILLLVFFSALWWARKGRREAEDIVDRTMPRTLEEPKEVVYTGDIGAGGRPVPYPYLADVQLPVRRPGSSSMTILVPPRPRPIQEVDGGAIEELERLPPQYQDIATPSSRRPSVARVPKHVAGV